MADILNQNTNDIDIEMDSLKDVDVSQYGINVSEEDAPGDDDGYMSMSGSNVPEEEIPVEDVPPGPGTGEVQAGTVPKFRGTESQIYRMTTDTYLDGFTMDTPIDPEEIAADILGLLARGIKTENSARSNDMKIKVPIGLPPETVAHVLLRLYPIVKLSLTPPGEKDKRETMPLAMYMEDGPDAGLYVTDEDEIGKLARKYNYRFHSKEIKDVLYQLSLEAPTMYLTDDRDLIAVNNGIFDYRTKTLMPFSPEYAFIAKSRVDYNPSAKNPVIRNDDGTFWDVESWVDSLTDDPELRQLLWQIIGAVIRPNVNWDKAPIFYAKKGNNGKGTLCVLLRNLCGPGTYTSIPLSNMGKEFMLESLTHAKAVITDENDVNTFLDKCANFKAIVTQDPIQINRKNRPAITVKFRGLVVECLNDMPKVKDKTGSFARRLLIIPFEKRFEGRENKAIKHDYLNRREVLEYVLSKVLNTNYYKFSEPRACLDMLGEFKVTNDPVRQFLEEVLARAQWDVLPYDFLFALYDKWFKINIPAGTAIGKNKFIDTVAEEVESTPEWGWTAPDRANPFRVRRGRMDCYEPMLEEYGLMNDWGAKTSEMGPGAIRSASIKDLATPGSRFLQKQVRGLVRMSDEQFDDVMKVQAEQVLEEFAAWFWDDPAGGLAWYVAEQFGDVDEEKAARVLMLSEDNMRRVMTVRRDFPNHRVLDMRYKPDELMAAVRDYWCRTHGNVSIDAMREKAREALDRYAEWFWNNGVVEYCANEPITGVIAPKDARKYAENADELMHMMGQASGRYKDEDWDIMCRLYTTQELAGHLRDYWFAHYGT